MKHLLVLLLFVSCAQTDPTPKKAALLSSLAGGWTFSAKTVAITGEFTLAVSPGGDFSVESGSFILNGKTYIASPIAIAKATAPLTLDIIWLNDLANQTSVGIESVSYPEDFTSMTGLKVNYFVKNGSMNTITETITISRK